jgi:hypothetical protein
MRTATVGFGVIGSALRFDTKYFLDSGNSAAERVYSGKWPLLSAAEIFGQDAIWMPGRFSRVWASDSSFGKPLLVPYDCFRYAPWSRSFLSCGQVPEYEQSLVKRGMLLIVRSGRNCGPVTMVDRFLETFAVSDDMLRISGELNDDRFYFYAFLATPTGQALVRRDRNGSVIDHLGPDQIAALRVPLVEDRLRKQCASKFREAFELREAARLLLGSTLEKFNRHFNLDASEASFKPAERARRFTVTCDQFSGRFDAEPLAPRYAAWRNRIRSSGGPPLRDIAEVFKPFGRNRTVYVEDERYGVRMMNGRQIAHYRPIALKMMSRTSLKDIDDYVLTEGTTLLTSDGRAEENLADCAFVDHDRSGWAASVHVHRVTPRPGVHPGLVYLACACSPVQVQLKALATGSVVDALSTGDVSSVIVPYADTAATRRLGDDARRAWGLFASATAAENEAIASLEAEFSS